MYKNINFLLEENPDTLPQVLLFTGIVLRNFLTHKRETDYFSLDIRLQIWSILQMYRLVHAGLDAIV